MTNNTTTVETKGCAWLLLVWMLVAVAFCGDPDLHDALIQRTMPVNECVPAEQETNNV